MKARIDTTYSKERQLLHKIVPLDTPFTVIVEPISHCNLKCNYCMYTLPKDEMVKKHNHIFAKLDRVQFDLFIEQLKKFPNQIKSVSFVGSGEPLLHEALPYMIKQLKKNGIAERITVVTNGVSLSERLSAELVNAGLDVLKISVNGLSSDDYLKTCNTAIDFDKYVSEIAWLYANKGKMEIYIKTLDTVLGERSVAEFHAIFGNYCDIITVENTLDYNYSKIPEESFSGNLSIHKGVHHNPDMCSALFYSMMLRSTGQFYLCCNPMYGISNEDMYINKSSISEIWNSKFRFEILLAMTQKNWSGNISNCKNCPAKANVAFEEDYLDPYADEIYQRLLQSSKTWDTK